MLTQKDILDLIRSQREVQQSFRTIREIISDGDLPRLQGATIQEGKVSDSVFGESLVSKEGKAIRLMIRSNRISTHDESRGEVPFKDQVLAINHDLMHNLLKDILGSSQFHIPGLKPTSTVIASENLAMFAYEHVMRRYMAVTSTETSLYQHWLKTKAQGLETMIYAGHQIDVNSLSPNCKLPYLMDTPSTKSGKDRTVSPEELFELEIITRAEYNIIRDKAETGYNIASDYLAKKGIILVDTKEEFGRDSEGKSNSGDELITMDSSRFWMIRDNGELIVDDSGNPLSFSKEFGRQLVESGVSKFSFSDSEQVAVRYITGIQHITGQEFNPDLRPRDERIIDSVNKALEYLM